MHNNAIHKDLLTHAVRLIKKYYLSLYSFTDAITFQITIVENLSRNISSDEFSLHRLETSNA
jgi:hypothetical protein